MRVYLDNSASTPLDKEVFKAMVPFLRDQFGDPASRHSHGLELKYAIENAKERIGILLNADPHEINFTNGGKDELIAAIEASGIDHIITTGYENESFMNSLKQLRKRNYLRISYIQHRDGVLDLRHLEFLLRTNTRNFITVTHLNLETGELNEIEKIANLASHYKAYFHIDATHSLGKYHFDLQKINFLSAPANRFHGPTGIGIFYHSKDTYIKLPPVQLCISHIKGLTVALEAAYENLNEEKEYITQLKSRMAHHFREFIPDAQIICDPEKSHYASLIVRFPRLFEDKSLQAYLDESHVSVAGINEPGFDIIHFSFSKLNTPEEIDYVTDNLTSLYERVNY